MSNGDHDSDIEDNYDGYDSDDNLVDEDEDHLFKEGVDNSNNEEKKIDEVSDEKGNNEDEDEDTNDVEDDEPEISVAIKRIPQFESGINKITFLEYSKMLTTLADNISESKLVVPDKIKDDIVGKEIDSIIIARNWIEKRFKEGYELPVFIEREALGFSKETIKPETLKTDRELSFYGLYEEENYFHTSFRPNGYTNEND